MPAFSTVPDIALDISRGRLVVRGSRSSELLMLPGATLNDRREWVELSLTLPMLQRIRAILGMDRGAMVARCSDAVLQWTRAATRAERGCVALHQQLADGWRLPFPWTDATGHPVTGQYREPFAHQLVMATAAAALDGIAFLCEVGTAKTRPALEAATFLMGQSAFDVLLIVCPKPIMTTWVRQAAEWSPSLTPTVLTGSIQQRGAQLRAITSTAALILNYDVVHPLIDDLIGLAGRLRVGLIFDEMHRIKNPQALRTKAAIQLADVSAWRLGLTGTPVLQGIQDVWSQWRFIDLGITFGANNVQYRREMLDENPYNHEIRAKPGALELVGERMRLRGLRYRKAECLDLPPCVYETVEVEMGPKQARAYRAMAETLVAELEDDAAHGVVAVASTALVKWLRLNQITSGFVIDAATERIVTTLENPKLDALADMLEDMEDQSVIVWCRFREDVRALAERFKDRHPVVIVGGQSAAVRKSADDAFRTGRAKLLIATPDSGGAGLDFPIAGTAIYFSQSYNPEARFQSEGRNHRAGSEIHERVTYIDLVCRGTVDDIIRKSLLGKADVAAVVTDLRRHIEGIAT